MKTVPKEETAERDAQKGLDQLVRAVLLGVVTAGPVVMLLSVAVVARMPRLRTIRSNFGTIADNRWPY